MTTAPDPAKPSAATLKRLVAEGYDAVASEYAALEARDAPWPRTRRLAELLAALPVGSAVLDLGCGAGVPATRLIIEAGHRATGIDASREQIGRARRAVPGARFRVGDAARVRFAPSSFDAVVAFYLLDHLPREEHAALYRRVSRWLRPGGRFLFSVEPVDAPGHTGRWLGVPMFFSGFDAATTLQLVRTAGLVVEDAEPETQLEGGRPVTFLWVLARRPDAR